MVIDSSKVKGIIFDIDGTLLDTMPMWAHVSEKYIVDRGKTPEEDLGDKVLAMTINEGTAYVKEKYNFEDPVEDIREAFLSMIRKFYYEEAPFLPGAKELVLELHRKNIPMVLCTSGDRDLATNAFKRLGVFDKFKGLVTCNEHNTHKGERYIFELASEMLLDGPATEEDYKDIYVFDDSLKAIKTVKEMGMIAVAMEDELGKTFWEALKQTGDYYIKNLGEVSVD